ncbi:MAG: dihydrofolate reductase [Micrococcaceae bacterium]|nr:dihydrofolate reductase [Micrococcaceae bacterium]
MSRHSADAVTHAAPTDQTGAGPRIGMIWAQTVDGVIGQGGTMPWHLPEDMKHFKHTTLGHPVIMGRRTWASIPAKFRPFAGRTTIVLTSEDRTAAEATEAPAWTLTLSEPAQGWLTAANGTEYRHELWERR